MNAEINFKSIRVQRAKSGQFLSPFFSNFLVVLIIGPIVTALFYVKLLAPNDKLFFLLLFFSSLYLLVYQWYRFDLSKPLPKKNPTNLDDILSPELITKLVQPLNAKSIFKAATQTDEGRFILIRLQLPAEEIIELLPNTPESTINIWTNAWQLVQSAKLSELDGAVVVASVLLYHQDSAKLLSRYKLKDVDVLQVLGWYERLISYANSPKPYFGGIGRDWATGFTPNLEKYSHDITGDIEAGGHHFHFLAHADVVQTIVHDLTHGSSGVAIIGPVGAGKTSLVYGLAERLLSGREPALKHYKVISLNASLILSSDKQNLERLMLTLFGEAVAAGNIILFLDEANLFFSEGVGALNIAQMLLPVMQNKTVKIIAAFSDNDFQHLKTTNEALANGFGVIKINEPSKEDTLKILQDSALTIEARNKVVISYQAVSEAYRLSGQYMSDQAYPGKAITLLEQASPYSQNGMMNASSVQMAIEKTLGVKVGTAEAAEVDILLNLEDKIHQRMINQSQAVQAVAAALRRVRAGVTNPNRPVGSFLFLGPTGVGKTELARSLAATYYGDAKQMIRLDMSEYQQPEDVKRLLADGADGESLILSIRKQPFSVVLLDEIEKAHPNILNLLLQLLDEGKLTDAHGRTASFKSAIIITTSNAGAPLIIQKIANGEDLTNFERPLIDSLIQKGQFKPELINRYDEIVLFRPLTKAESNQVAELMIKEVNKNLSVQNISIKLTDQALAAIVEAGYDPEFGARPMRHIIQKNIEDLVATRILQGAVEAGGSLNIDLRDIQPLKR